MQIAAVPSSQENFLRRLERCLPGSVNKGTEHMVNVTARRRPGTNSDEPPQPWQHCAPSTSEVRSTCASSLLTHRPQPPPETDHLGFLPPPQPVPNQKLTTGVGDAYLGQPPPRCAVSTSATNMGLGVLGPAAAPLSCQEGPWHTHPEHPECPQGGTSRAVTAAGTGSKYTVPTQEPHHPSPSLHGARTCFSLLPRIKKADE